MAEKRVEVSETRSRRRIRQAVETAGLIVGSIEWEPWGVHVEKSGPEGGWTVRTTDGQFFVGMNTEDVLADIAWWTKTKELVITDG